jgi:hypothetical protein
MPGARMRFRVPRVATTAPAPLGPLNLVLHGNSLFAGVAARVAALRPGTDVVEEIVQLGATTAQLEANFDDVDALWDPTRTNVVVLWEGLDHINDDGGTGATAHAAYASYVANAESFGGHAWRVWVCTIIDTTEYTATNPHPTRGNLEPERDDFNVRLRADKAGGERIVDLALRDELDDATNLTYFSGDGIHITAAGADAVADEIHTVAG